MPSLCPLFLSWENPLCPQPSRATALMSDLHRQLLTAAGDGRKEEYIMLLDRKANVEYQDMVSCLSSLENKPPDLLLLAAVAALLLH